jgi:hypothetical protein
MVSQSECHQRAQECVDIAKSADAYGMEKLLHLARAWLQLAEDIPPHPPLPAKPPQTP